MKQKISLVDLLEGYFYKWTLQSLLEQAGLKKSGTKRELAERLVYESDYDPVFLLSKLTKDELLCILEEEFSVKVPKSTKKEVMISMILEELGENLPSKRNKTKSKQKAEVKNSDKPIEHVVYNSLKSFRPYKFDSESKLEGQLVVYLRSTVPAEITPQKAGAKRGDILVPDIVIDDIAIEIKFFRKGASKSEWDRSIGQVIRYFLDGKYRKVFLFVVDHAGIVPEEVIEDYENLLPWLKIIVRKY